jgi:hypothetical protein
VDPVGLYPPLSEFKKKIVAGFPGSNPGLVKWDLL